MKFAFWFSLFLVFYTYVGYGIVLFLIIKVKRWLVPPRLLPPTEPERLPTLALVIAAYNEEPFIVAKLQNTLALKYPSDKLRIVFVTDGSSDRTPEIVRQYQGVELMHQSDRNGKINAIHRAMEEIDSEVVVFTDANTFLNPEALLLIAGHYQDPEVGAVSGEKRVNMGVAADATAGEGFYWKYESVLKKWDSELYSVVGAAGELFSVRNALYKPVQPDTILDDFMISLLIAAQGYRIIYEPNAFAVEQSSENITEELKRKIRIAAGGIQSILRLKILLNPFRFPVLSFQYISHRVLRWTVTPFALISLFISNLLIFLEAGELFYEVFFAAQIGFYVLALAGWLFSSISVKIKVLFIPYYFCMMNYAVFMGIVRYLNGSQGAVWEKAIRKSETKG